AEVPGRPDGLALASAGNGGPAYTPRTRVAEALTAAAHPPRLVVFNVPYSGLRMASECVGAGAGAALGFVDTFDDALAELFFGEFLRQWRSSRRSRSDGALLAAFTAAWNVLREPDADLRGTGIVLWSAEPLLEKGERALDEAPALRSERAGAGRGERGKATPRAPAAGPADLVVQVTPLPAFNYALLHNDRPLFDRFALIPPPDQPATDVEVQVVLHVGVDSFPFRKHIALVDRSTSLAHEIRVPLTSSGLRQLGERVFTR
ncbi:MAG TPA: hypothetical protein VK081_00635, partial [Planctomycetota bacterium]|nr:hypothetical protein [Planctomycetota bacterium]